MNQEFKDSVPYMISGKDLDYLSDMFEWNHLAYKKYSDYKDKVTDEQLKNLFDDASQLFYANMQDVLAILEGGNNE